jgi:hypothetical protein
MWKFILIKGQRDKVHVCVLHASVTQFSAMQGGGALPFFDPSHVSFVARSYPTHPLMLHDSISCEVYNFSFLYHLVPQCSQVVWDSCCLFTQTTCTCTHSVAFCSSAYMEPSSKIQKMVFYSFIKIRNKNYIGRQWCTLRLWKNNTKDSVFWAMHNS